MVVSSRLLEGRALVAGVHQREAAGAVGRFHHAGRKAGLPHGGGLLVARHAGDRQRLAEQVGGRAAELGIVVADLRQDRRRHVEEPQQLLVPALLVDVEQQGARGVGDIGGMHRAAGQAPEQETVDGAEGQFAALGAGAQAVHAVEQPGDLGGGEIGVEQQAGARPRVGLAALPAQAVAKRGAAPVLPDDGLVYRRAGGPIPEHRGLALVGDADRIDGAVTGQRHQAPRRGQAVAPDVLGVVLDPAGPRVVLRQLDLPLPGGPARGVEENAAAAGGALVDRQDVARRGHPGAALPLGNRCFG